MHVCIYVLCRPYPLRNVQTVQQLLLQNNINFVCVSKNTTNSLSSEAKKFSLKYFTTYHSF